MWNAKMPKRMGRPPKYKTAEELYEKVTEYFEEGCVVERTTAIGTTYEDKVPTLTGLCLYLGFSDLQGMHYQSERGEDFFRVLKAAKTMVSSYHEEKVASGDGWSGNMFWLKVHEKWVEAKPEEKEEVKTHKYQITLGKSKCK